MQFSSVLASLLCLTSTLVTAIPLNASPRAAAVASITKITAVGGSACSSPSDWEEGFRDDAPATRQINYFNFGVRNTRIQILLCGAHVDRTFTL